MRRWGKRTCSRVLWLAVVAALIPLPAVADDTGITKRLPSIKESAAQVVARDVWREPARPSARDARQAGTSTNSTSFFKSRPGMIALAVMAVGAGYAVYSAQHDRIRSAGKQ